MTLLGCLRHGHTRFDDPRRATVTSPGITVTDPPLCGPDLVKQLQQTDTYRVDAFFLTQFHRDHADGLLELLQTLRSGTRTAWNNAGDRHSGSCVAR